MGSNNTTALSHISNNKFVLLTFSDGIKRSLESVSKRIDSFIYYSGGASTSRGGGHTLSTTNEPVFTERSNTSRVNYKTIDAISQKKNPSMMPAGA